MSARARRIRDHGLVYASAAVLCCISLIPLAWGLSTSLKPESKVYASPPQWIPNPLTLDNFAAIVHNGSMLRYLGNSAIISVGTTLLALVVGILGAYGFSRRRFPGRSPLLWSILFTQLFPRVVVIVPFYITLRNLDLLNTYPGLILVYLMITFPVAIWLLKGFFDRVPAEIEEAGVIDGCSTLQLLYRIVLPISLPAIAAVAMYAFVLAWNEFLFALVFTNGLDKRPISVGLAFFINENGVEWGQLMAASILMCIPSVIVFALSQKLLVRGLSEGAVKG